MRRALALVALLALLVVPAGAAARDLAVLSKPAKAFGWRAKPKVMLLPSLPAPPTPPPLAPPGPAPAATPAPQDAPAKPQPQTPPKRDPWFLTVHARDVGNGDFRLLPAIGDIPAGTLYLSYLNEDQTAHDLWLRVGATDTELFGPYVGGELRRTRLELTPGTYELLCKMPGHEQMRRGFEVTP